MAQHAKSLTAICLKSIDYTERARIASYFSREQGPLDVLIPYAKGPKSKQGGASELGQIFTLHVKAPQTGTGLFRLEQYELSSVFTFPKALNYEVYQALMPCLELMRKLGNVFSHDESKCPRVFAQYEVLLTLWQHAESTAFLRWSMLWFWQGILSLSGQVPSWAWDLRHQRPLQWEHPETTSLYYLPLEGGIVASDLPHGKASTPSEWGLSHGVWKSLWILEHLQKQPFKAFLEVPMPPEKTLQKLENFYRALLESQSLPLKSLTPF
ncbi:MAG: hypothetical protein HEQ32_04630 [Vampirovibrio sp.]